MTPMGPAASRPTRILLVEDNPGDARLLRENLRRAPEFAFEMVHVDRLEAAYERLRGHSLDAPFDVLVLDLKLPDSEGLNTVTLVHSKVPYMPIVVLTGGDEALGLEALRRGAQDYLLKGQVDGPMLARSIRYATERKRMEAALRQANDLLELRIQQRTAELENAITSLGDEVSERREAEQGLKESETMFRQFAEAIPQIIWIATADLTRMLYVNSAFERLHGITRDVVYKNGAAWMESVHPDDRKRVMAGVREWLRLAAGGGSSHSMQFRVIRPDGSVAVAHGRSFAVRDERGQLLRICGIAEEVTAAEGEKKNSNSYGHAVGAR
ncbi:MAG: PAS domain-containing protein [Phycisphaerae bacterium]